MSVSPRRVLNVALMAMAMLLAPVASRAAVIFSTLGPGDSFFAATPYDLGGFVSQAIAVPFQPAEDVLLDHIRIALRPGAGSAPSVWLASDSAGDPGAQMAGFPVPDPFTEGLVTLVPDASTPLSAGTTFWIVVTAAAAPGPGWFFNDQNVFGGYKYRNAVTGQAWVSGGLWIPALEVSASPVPEPHAVAAFMAGGLLLVLAGRHRRPGAGARSIGRFASAASPVSR